MGAGNADSELTLGKEDVGSRLPSSEGLVRAASQAGEPVAGTVEAQRVESVSGLGKNPVAVA
jgi:hypothetical protein